MKTALGTALLLATLLLPQPATAQIVERSPYLQSTSETSTTIVWKTLLPGNGELHWGDSPSTLTNVVNSPFANQHAVTVSGLSPDTRYYYAVYQDSTLLAGADINHWFETNPTVGSEGKFRVWVVGDSGTGGLSQALVRDAMADWVGATPADLYIHVGDMAYGDGTELQFSLNFYAVYADVLRNTTVWPALGNHEGHSSDSGSQSGPYYDGYVLPTAGEAGGLASGTEAYYSFDYANAHFIVLDSYDSPRDPSGAMLIWLAADLAATTQEWIVASWHHPPYTDGSHNSDEEIALTQMRENALPILEAGGVDLVLTGHSHIYERSYLLNGAFDTPTTSAGVIDWGDGRPAGDGPYVKDPADPTVGTVHIVAGHGGTGVSGTGNHPVMMFSEVANGSVALDFHGNRLNITNVRSDGVVTDRAAIVRGDAILVITPDGNESLASGTTATIDWTTAGSVGAVDIAWSCDGGTTWLGVAQGLLAANTFDWTVPSIEASNALIRVSSSDAPSLFDESNGTFTVGSSGSQEAISWGALWSYDDSGTDLGTAWRSLTYDDSTWSSGLAQLGYGDGDEVTELYDPSPNYPSHYFRHSFTLSSGVVSAELSALYDDGVIVWLNGSQVMSRDALLGDDYSAWATGGSDDNEVSTENLSGSNFVVGENILAVMVKQRSGSSSDLSFDLRLEVEVLGDDSSEPCEAEGDDDDSAPGDDDDDDSAGGDDDDSAPDDDDDSAPGDDDDASADDDDSGDANTSDCSCGGGASAMAFLPLLLIGLRRMRP